MDKKLKDPIYGYIQISNEFIKGVIDTAIFQRLRRIIQTSYAPLYSSAIHNRFVHSIGVFHLGSIVAEQLKKEILVKKLLSDIMVKHYAKIYQLACLLHDVGHAPFSHTGEGFYKNDDYKSTELHQMLIEAVGSKEFESDIPQIESESAAPHEIMSCIVGIKEFKELLADEADKELFARCITGYAYKTFSIENEIKNCFISMLNSKVIDVDRLDYLIRDAYITGFETVNIDYERLLKAITIVEYDGHYKIAYRKNALSIIENVVYAHDAEKKWIQNHPVVLYECYLIQHIIAHLNDSMNEGENKLFSVAALSREGVNLKGGIHISLLCDDDIVYLFKNLFPDATSMEFFERENRRHPVWKSEAEYKAYISAMSSEGQIKEDFLDCLGAFAGGKQKDVKEPIIINEELVRKLENEVAELKEKSEKILSETKDPTTKKSIRQQQKGASNKLKLCKYLVEYAKNHNMQDDFLIVKANMFNSNFSKEEITKVLIVFDQGEEESIKRFSEVCNTLKADGIKEEFYYLYYRRGKCEIQSKEDFCKSLYFAAIGR